MASTRVSQNLPPNLDPTKSELAFGRRGIEKLAEEIRQTDDKELTIRALATLVDVVHNPESIKQFVNQGVLPNLAPLLTNGDVYTRRLSALLVCATCQHAVGRAAVIEAKLPQVLADKIHDDSGRVREAVYQALRVLAGSEPGVAEVLRLNLLSAFVKKLKLPEPATDGGVDSDVPNTEEAASCKCAILDTLWACLSNSAHAATSSQTMLDCHAMRVLCALLESTDMAVVKASARVIQGLSFPLDGKLTAVEDGAVPALTAILFKEGVDADTKSPAAGALMSIFITTEGKKAGLECKTATALADCLNKSRNESLLLNVVKAATCLSEAPAVRAFFKNHLQRIEQLEGWTGAGRDTTALARAATKLRETVTWTP